MLLRTESAASSNIENLTASARAIGEAELSPPGRSNAALIVANTTAMNAAIGFAARIDRDAILAMHRALLERSRPEIAGRWRDEQVWIGGEAIGPHEALFVQPHHRHLTTAIDDLLVYIGRDDVPVLAHAAVAHAHFETIHPFADGNGRTGRALLHAQLRNKRLTRNVTVPVSAGLLTDTDAYFDALTAYRAGDPLPIVERLASAAFTAIENGRRLVADLGSIRSGWDGRLRLRRDATAWRVLDVLMRHPVVDAGLLAGELEVAPQNTYRALESLTAAEIVVESTDKRRNHMWRAPEVLAARRVRSAGPAAQSSRAPLIRGPESEGTYLTPLASRGVASARACRGSSAGARRVLRSALGACAGPVASGSTPSARPCRGRRRHEVGADLLAPFGGRPADDGRRGDSRA